MTDTDGMSDLHLALIPLLLCTTTHGSSPALLLANAIAVDFIPPEVPQSIARHLTAIDTHHKVDAIGQIHPVFWLSLSLPG